MRVLHVATSDAMGGAGRVASDLTRFERQAGIDAVLAVATKRGAEPFVVTIDEPRRTNSWFHSWRALRDSLPSALGSLPLGRRVAPVVRRTLGAIADPRAAISYARGREDFAFSSSRRLPDVFQPDLIHCHNLHGNYFDLTALPELSKRQPVMVTLHDCWLMTGHCAQPMACERWRTGCGNCPDLSIAPAVGRDDTAFNWQRKADIFRRSRIAIALPSRWLEPRVRNSMLLPAGVEMRVIPHGVDLAIFRPGDRERARQLLGLPMSGYLLLASANGGRANSYKDIGTFEDALDGLVVDAPVTAVILGESGPAEQRGGVLILRLPFEENIERVAEYYRAADIYVHATRAEVLPVSIIEALACGIPTIASDVGGVPELVVTTRDHHADAGVRPTGELVTPGNVRDLREAITSLLADTPHRLHVGDNAARGARERFDVTLQVRRYTDWYEEILSGPGLRAAARMTSS